MENDPLKRAEQMLRQFETEAASAMTALRNTASSGIDQALITAAASHRRLYSFSTALAEATGRNIYRRGWSFAGSLPDSLRARWIRLHLPTSPLPGEAVRVIEELRCINQSVLASKGSVVVSVSEYESQTGRRPKFPSRD
jgi:hypothetical protein